MYLYAVAEGYLAASVSADRYSVLLLPYENRAIIVPGRQYDHVTRFGGIDRRLQGLVISRNVQRRRLCEGACDDPEHRDGYPWTQHVAPPFGARYQNYSASRAVAITALVSSPGKSTQGA